MESSCKPQVQKVDRLEVQWHELQMLEHEDHVSIYRDQSSICPNISIFTRWER